MLKILTSAQMREVDRLTSERFGVPSLTLMENAAASVAAVVIEQLGSDFRDKKIAVVCGIGNNGGDGAAVARMLAAQGAKVSVLMPGSVEDCSGDTRINFERIKEPAANISLVELSSVEDVDQAIRNAHVVIDALFGTGLSRPLTDANARVATLIDRVRSERTGAFPIIVAVDLPSGLDADSASPIGPHATADVTVTFTAPKLANVMPPASRACGKTVVSEIGSPPVLIGESTSSLFEANGADAANWMRLTEFSFDSYKNKRGNVLIVAGSGNYPGAAVLNANAAMMSGVGLVTLVAPRSAREMISARLVPEVIMHSVEGGESIGAGALGEIHNLVVKGADAVAFGSGMTSESAEVRSLARALVEERRTPIVVDADGLNALSPFELKGSDDLPVILTPHEGEFLRLSGFGKEEVARDRIGALRSFATRTGCIVVLKGQRNLVASPDGRVVLVPTGNSGLGKAGSGDTLTGIIVGFTAQAVRFKVGIFDTVVAAVYIAGLAGEIAKEKWGERVMLASDVRDCLSEAFGMIEGARRWNKVTGDWKE